MPLSRAHTPMLTLLRPSAALWSSAKLLLRPARPEFALLCSADRTAPRPPIPRPRTCVDGSVLAHAWCVANHLTPAQSSMASTSTRVGRARSAQPFTVSPTDCKRRVRTSLTLSSILRYPLRPYARSSPRRLAASVAGGTADFGPARRRRSTAVRRIPPSERVFAAPACSAHHRRRFPSRRDAICAALGTRAVPERSGDSRKSTIRGERHGSDAERAATASRRVGPSLFSLRHHRRNSCRHGREAAAAAAAKCSRPSSTSRLGSTGYCGLVG